MKTKANIGLALVITFAVTLLAGIILHLKSHEIIIQPRGVLKTVHWIFGYAMTVLLVIHWTQFRKMLDALKNKFRWFYIDTWLLIILFIATLLTGTVKLLSPVKIPHLGLWHYWFGMAMGVTAFIHLIRGLPSWNRMRARFRKHNILTAVLIVSGLLAAGCSGNEPDQGFSMPADGTLRLVNYLGNEQNIHPKVLYFEQGWNGHRFWMAYTPYPQGNTDAENPCLAVSDDGANWECPAGVTNPIAPTPPTGYNSDTHLMYNSADNSLECWCRGFDRETNKDYILRSISRDGVKWTEAETVFPTSEDRTWMCLSPAVSIIDGKYVMLYSNGRDLYLMRSEAKAPEISWGTPVKVEVEGDGLMFWHQDMVLLDDGHKAVVPVCCYTKGNNNNSADLYGLILDLDKATGTQPKMLIARGTVKPDFTSQSLYRSSIVNVGDRFILYYSGIEKGNDFRHMDIVTGNRDELLDYLRSESETPGEDTDGQYFAM